PNAGHGLAPREVTISVVGSIGDVDYNFDPFMGCYDKGVAYCDPSDQRLVAHFWLMETPSGFTTTEWNKYETNMQHIHDKLRPGKWVGRETQSIVKQLR
ncbi:hypothetical protein FRB99_004739, partial [Tulasnella sp. 403]